jgi:hypothetical protein
MGASENIRQEPMRLYYRHQAYFPAESAACLLLSTNETRLAPRRQPCLALKPIT